MTDDGGTGLSMRAAATRPIVAFDMLEGLDAAPSSRSTPAPRPTHVTTYDELAPG